MKSTGIVRKIDELGRIVLPKELRKTLGISERDPIEIFVKDDYIMLQKHAPTCVFCGTTEDLSDFKEKSICKTCAAQLQKQDGLD